MTDNEKTEVSPKETKPAGFGSFNSGNVEDMISDDAWMPPQPPAFILDLAKSSGALAGGYGADMKRHFMLEEEWTFVNHGAFGSPLASAFEASERWRRHAELQPLRFIDRQLFVFVRLLAVSQNILEL